MIIKRLAAAMRRQEWFTVVLETIVVVIGIFIGLQADDWNSARQDRQDEQEFMWRLHSDMMLAEKLTVRLRDRRLDQVGALVTAGDVFFERTDRDELSEKECTSIGASNLFNINAPSIPAFDELIGIGRLGIIRDVELRGALVSLEQTRRALSALISIQSGQSTFTHLPSRFPDLLRMVTYVEPGSNEIRIHFTCDLAGMKSNQQFLNQWAVNADGYDAFVRDGLAPWVAQFEKVHELVDAAIGVDHGHNQTVVK